MRSLYRGESRISAFYTVIVMPFPVTGAGGVAMVELLGNPGVMGCGEAGRRDK